ncbi:MAG: oligosaccharide flippase family protein [Anaerolineales bacterium]
MTAFFRRILPKIFGRDILDLLNHSKNYFLTSAFAQGLVFLVMPLLTRILTPADYGTYQVFRSYAEVFAILLTLNFHGAVSRYYYDAQPDLNEFIGASILGSHLVIAVAALILFFFPLQIADFLKIPIALVWLLIGMTSVKIIDSVFNQLTIASKDSQRYSFVNNARAILSLSLGVGLALLMRQDKYYGLAFGQALGSLLVGGYIFTLIKEKIRWRVKREHFFFILGYSVPLVPYVVSTMFLDKLDRILINKIVSASSAGLYSFAYNIGMVVSMVTDALNGAFVPDWFRLMREEKYEEINVITLKTFRFVLLASVGALLFSYEVFALISSKEYHAALLIMPIIISGYLFDFLSKVYLRNLGLARRMLEASLLGIVTVALNFALNVIFLPIYGYVAAAYSTLVSYAFLTALAWVTSKYILKHVVVPWRVFVAPLGYFSIALAAYYAIMGMQIETLWKLILKAFVMALFGLALFHSSKQSRVRAN